MTDLTREQIAWNAGRDAAADRIHLLYTENPTKADVVKYIRNLQAPQFQPAPKGNTMSIKTATNAIANAKVKLDELYARLTDDYDKLLAQDVMTHLKRADEALGDAEAAKSEAIQAWDKL